MDNPLLSSLSSDERASLALCGVTRDVQLSRNSAAALWRDLEQSRELFPERSCTLTQEKLERLCRQAAAAYPDEAGDEDIPVPEPTSTEQEADELNLIRHNRSYPTFRPIRRSRRSRKHAQGSPDTQADGEKDDDVRMSDKRHCVHGRHSLATWLGAWATLLLVADMVAFLCIPIAVFMGGTLPFSVQQCAIIALICALPWFCFVGTARCAVCSMKTFSFRRYVHSKNAHRVPLLGIVIPTALHVAFLGWYRCPACGTPQKLFRRRRHS